MNIIFSNKFCTNIPCDTIKKQPGAARLFYNELIKPFSMEYAFFIGTLICMRAEIVTLRLNQVSRQNSGTIAIVVGNSRREGWNRNTILHCICNHIAQRLLIIIGDLLEVRRQQQVGNARILLIGISDLLQELSTDDAACTEDFSNFAVVQIPVVFIRRSTELGRNLERKRRFCPDRERDVLSQ